MPDDPLLAEARARVAALRGALEAAEDAPVRVIETHVSWVLLARQLAYKIKKPVCLAFLDFTSLAERRRCCDEELRLNRRFAPDLYLDVIDVRQGARGPSFGGSGEVVDAAVRMRRFADGALWSERVASGTLQAAQLDAFARRLAACHRDAAVAPPASGFGAAAGHARVVEGVVAAIAGWHSGHPSTAPEWPALRDWLREELAGLDRHWRERLHAGAVRECHGDLQLSNVVQLGDEAVAFDALEFAAELRWIDPLDDVAFLVMDLLANGRRDLAFRFLDVYLEASGDHDGLPALRFFLVTRALVRAQVCLLRNEGGAARAGHGETRRYLELASALAHGRDPRLAITCGLPGSGKTFASQSMLEAVGAVRVRSDVERKRLFGIASLQSSRGLGAGAIYDAAANERTYERLFVVARTALLAGWPTVVDAAFLRRAERARFAALAATLAAPFTIVACRADPPLLRQRVAARRDRGDDASEADVDVLERLTNAAEPLDATEAALAIVSDAGPQQSPGDLARRWKQAR
ncbi:MAG: AAA family ATPase [Caldimonas sp.]